ncbi:hypothetical protein BH11PAT4_BH11PAT4_2120 [soil metagenome]
MFLRFRTPLIFLNLCMGFLALGYDIPAIRQVPWFMLPFILICPLYPFLLALHLSLAKPQVWLQAFATIPPTIYGGLALAFYPLSMLNSGFTWNETGQIVWVLLYAVQAFLLLPRKHSSATYTAAAFTLVSLCVLFVTNSYGYLAIAALPQSAKISLLCLGFVLVTLTTGVIKHHSLLNRGEELT